MVSGNSVTKTLVFFIPLLLTSFCANAIYQAQPEKIIGSLLRLKRTPISIRNARCASGNITDVITTCAFDVNPIDFPALLKGWQFTQAASRGGSYSFAGVTGIGPEFAVDTEFFVNDPPEFAYGGRVSVVANAARSRVQVDYYRE